MWEEFRDKSQPSMTEILKNVISFAKRILYVHVTHQTRLRGYSHEKSYVSGTLGTPAEWQYSLGAAECDVSPTVLWIPVLTSTPSFT